jgi:hypothetical protein
MAKSYDTMTVAELEAENQKLSAEREEIRQRKKEINEILSDKAAQVKVESLAASLTDSERKALAQVIQPKGIALKAEIGKM